MSLKMQTTINVLKVALSIRRSTFLTEDDESRGISINRASVVAKTLSKTSLTNDWRLTERNLSSELGISKNIVQKIFKDDLHTDL